MAARERRAPREVVTEGPRGHGLGASLGAGVGAGVVGAAGVVGVEGAGAVSGAFGASGAGAGACAGAGSLVAHDGHSGQGGGSSFFFGWASDQA